MGKHHFDEINNISKSFYDTFNTETKIGYALAKDLDKYVLHAIYSFVCAHHDVELTFEDWLRKNDFLYENDKGR